MNITGVDFIAGAYGRLRAGEGVLRRRARVGVPQVLGVDALLGEFQAGNLTLAVMQSDAFGMEFRPSRPSVALQVDDVEAARAELGARASSSGQDTLDSGVCYQAFFADPDGNPLILHHRDAPNDARPAGA